MSINYQTQADKILRPFTKVTEQLKKFSNEMDKEIEQHNLTIRMAEENKFAAEQAKAFACSRLEKLTGILEETPTCDTQQTTTSTETDT